LFHVAALDPMGTDLPEVVLVPVEHRISIVYAKHDNVDVGSRETALPKGREIAANGFGVRRIAGPLQRRLYEQHAVAIG
jgi:hypothetical protein